MAGCTGSAVFERLPGPCCARALVRGGEARLRLRCERLCVSLAGAAARRATGLRLRAAARRCAACWSRRRVRDSCRNLSQPSQLRCCCRGVRSAPARRVPSCAIMSLEDYAPVFALGKQALMLDCKGKPARAAAKFDEALALAASFAPDDCLVVASLKQRAAMFAAVVINDEAEPIEFGHVLKHADLAFTAAAVCVRRYAAGTLLPGECRPAEEAWHAIMMETYTNIAGEQATAEFLKAVQANCRRRCLLQSSAVADDLLCHVVWTYRRRVLLAAVGHRVRYGRDCRRSPFAAGSARRSAT